MLVSSFAVLRLEKSNFIINNAPTETRSPSVTRAAAIMRHIFVAFVISVLLSYKEVFYAENDFFSEEDHTLYYLTAAEEHKDRETCAEQREPYQ